MGWYGSSSHYGGGWAPYVPVAKRRQQAQQYAKRQEKQLGRKLAPIAIEGRNIACSFWGKAWCTNLEGYSDFSNRLPRGRTYVRNGSVIDLHIEEGQITAMVSGSSVYTVKIEIDTLAKKMWKSISCDCANSVASLIDLLQGRFDSGVMERLTRSGDGLFPQPDEIRMECSCPDYAGMCKHIAAVMYGIGARLDESPELLFTLRCVDHLELISQAVASDNLDRTLSAESTDQLRGEDLGAIFGIELETTSKKPAKSHPGVPKRSSPAQPTTKTKAAKPTTRSKSADDDGKAIGRVPKAKTGKPTKKALAATVASAGARRAKPSRRQG